MREITPDQLREILDLHKKWRESGSKEGAKADLGDADLHGANLRNTNLTCADLSGADLRNANLFNADLSGVDLSGANLSHANLDNADLVVANLNGADLRYACLRDTNLTCADLSGADLRNAGLVDTNLTCAELSGTELSNAFLYRVKFGDANLSKANLEYSALVSADLEDADLTKANISGANIFHLKTHGWKIDGIKCTHVYNCPLPASEEDREKSRINFKEGEFEAKHKTMPTIELVLSGGFRMQDHYKMNHIINEVSNKYGANLEVSGLKKEFGGMSVTLESKSDKEIEEMGRMIVKEYKNRELDNKLIATIRQEKILGAEPDKPEVHHHYHHVVQKFDFGHLLGATVTTPGIGTINIIGGDVKGTSVALGKGATATTIINNYARNKEKIDKTLEDFKKEVSEDVRQQVEALTDALKEKDEKKASGAWGKIKKVFAKAEEVSKTGETATKLSRTAIDLYHKLEGLF